MSDTLLKLVPDWGAYWLRVESDALVMEATAPERRNGRSARPRTGPRPSSSTSRRPRIVASVANDFGKTLRQMLDLYGSDPAFTELARPARPGARPGRRRDAAFGWIGDTAIVVNDAGTPEGGLSS